ncbi:MAG TPA: hypothetical protein VMA75_01140 [Candidatus Paceibacterota bacterium]|nr:hypothetical protein [Candidatus Paceibacterota bacterium]
MRTTIAGSKSKRCSIRSGLFFVCAAIGGIFFAFAFSPSRALAATNINATSSQHSAWNDEIGWIDFYSTGNVTVGSSQLTGYASSSAGPISLDCATSPSGNICSSSEYDVSNDGSGDLSGWAWNDEIGWISFYWGNASANSAATTTALCQSYGSYCGVSINGSGVFQGWAWNDDVGWIDFNCANVSESICSTSNFEVATSWAPQAATGTLDSQTFDTGVAAGAQLNSVTWYGSLPAGTSVAFQIAVSNSSSGPWNFQGTDGTSATTYPTLEGVPTPLTNYSSLSGRYFRYRIILTSDLAQTVSPRVDSVIVNWSP